MASGNSNIGSSQTSLNAVKNAANTPQPAPPIISVEKLEKSLEPEKPLVIDGSGILFGSASGSSGAGNQP